MTTFSLAAGPTSARLGSLRGTVLELGPGAGGNLRHYHPGVRWVGVEPNARHRRLTRREATRLGRGAEVLPGSAERLALADGIVDAAVATFVLCSVADPAAALAELYRVLRPGGRYVFAEHVAAPAGTWLRRGQRLWGAATSAVGCRPDRESLAAIELAGFEVVELHKYVLPGPFGAGIPHVAGAAVRTVNTKGITR
ncbi:MAG TPA: class I SAM-dependent methyltransferase [Actinophytocola sp.]|nr:class I SAM-dependent methyltransferase [Actinophytocola sp.]